MKALFVTTDTDDMETLIGAWQPWNAAPARRVSFAIRKNPVDPAILGAAREYVPDVIFYVGGNAGPGLPSHDTFKALRGVAKTVHLCWDASDYPWHETLFGYAVDECFDLQVAIDGALDAPVDMATLCPIDPRAFDEANGPRDIRCGFSGQAFPEQPRWDVIGPLLEKSLVTVRQRSAEPYPAYAGFLRRCEIVFNSSICGSGTRHQVKMRVIETALAGAALLETEGSPTERWFPREAMFHYRDAAEAERIIATASRNEVEDRAARLAEEVRADHRPEDIYRSILARVGL